MIDVILLLITLVVIFQGPRNGVDAQAVNQVQCYLDATASEPKAGKTERVAQAQQLFLAFSALDQKAGDPLCKGGSFFFGEVQDANGTCADTKWNSKEGVVATASQNENTAQKVGSNSTANDNGNSTTSGDTTGSNDEFVNALGATGANDGATKDDTDLGTPCISPHHEGNAQSKQHGWPNSFRIVLYSPNQGYKSIDLKDLCQKTPPAFQACMSLFAKQLVAKAAPSVSAFEVRVQSRLRRPDRVSYAQQPTYDELKACYCIDPPTTTTTTTTITTTSPKPGGVFNASSRGDKVKVVMTRSICLVLLLAMLII